MYLIPRIAIDKCENIYWTSQNFLIPFLHSRKLKFYIFKYTLTTISLATPWFSIILEETGTMCTYFLSDLYLIKDEINKMIKRPIPDHLKNIKTKKIKQRKICISKLMEISITNPAMHVHLHLTVSVFYHILSLFLSCVFYQIFQLSYVVSMALKEVPAFLSVKTLESNLNFVSKACLWMSALILLHCNLTWATQQLVESTIQSLSVSKHDPLWYIYTENKERTKRKERGKLRICSRFRNW